MSVLKVNRNTSSMQFITNVRSLNADIIRFVLKLGNKYTRIMEETLVNNANNLLDCVLAANDIRAIDDVTYEARRSKFKEAKHIVDVLTVQLGIVLDLSLNNDPNDKVKNVENLCQSLGEQLDTELKLLNGIMASDKDRYRDYKAKKLSE